MNNRQKAKHFKRLYEMELKKPCPIVFQHVGLKHYKTLIPIESCDDVPMDWIEDKLIQNLEDALKANVKLEEDTDIYDRKVYSLDVWTER